MTKGKLIGYIRVSTLDQNPDRQLEGIRVDKLFTDKASGKSLERPQLMLLLDYARDGDTVVVHSMDRLARNLEDLRRLVSTLNHKDVKVQFLKENLIFTGDDSAMSTLMLSLMGAFAEFERSLIKERQKEGIALAKQRGVYKGRKKALSIEQAEQMFEKLERGHSKASLAREFNISRETFYQYLKKK